MKLLSLLAITASLLTTQVSQASPAIKGLPAINPANGEYYYFDAADGSRVALQATKVPTAPGEVFVTQVHFGKVVKDANGEDEFVGSQFFWSNCKMGEASVFVCWGTPRYQGAETPSVAEFQMNGDDITTATSIENLTFREAHGILWIEGFLTKSLVRKYALEGTRAAIAYLNANTTELVGRADRFLRKAD